MTDQHYAPPSADLSGPPPRRNTGQITQDVIEMVKGTRPWVRVAGIVAMIIGGLTVIGALFMMLGMGAMMMAGSGDDAMAGAMGIGMGFVYLVLSLFYFLPGLFLIRCAGAMDRLERSRDSDSLVAVFRHQRSFWRFVGVATLLMILLFVLGMAAAVLVPLLTTMNT